MRNNLEKQTKKQRRKVKTFEELTYTDTFLFGEVMHDENTCKIYH